MTPSFTVLIGSSCRDSLWHSLDSVARQNRVTGDQVIVSIDAHGRGPCEDVQERVRSYGPGFVATSYDAGYGWLGVEQINHAMRTIEMTGSHALTIGDDDVFVDGAYDAFREACAQDPLRPVLWRFVAPNRWVLWDRPRMAACLISGCCIAAPMPYVDLMHTRLETTHDFDWMAAVIEKAAQDGKAPVWLDYIGVVARPSGWSANPVHSRPTETSGLSLHCYCGRPWGHGPIVVDAE